MDKLIMNINDYKSINQANIEINRLNIVSGVNGSGKSTLSRILYSFLKGNSIKRRNNFFEGICDSFNRIIDVLSEDYVDYDFPDRFKATDTIDDMIEKFNSLYEITKKHEKICETKIKEAEKKSYEEYDSVVEKLKNEGILNSIDEVKLRDEDSLSLKSFKLNMFAMEKNEELADIFDNLFKLNSEKEFFKNTLIAHLMCKLNGQSLKQYLDEDSYEISEKCFKSLLSKEEGDLISSNFFTFEIEFSNHSKANPYEYFFNKGFINNIYYFDNVSVIDLYLALNADLNLKESILRHNDEFIGELFKNNDYKNFDYLLSGYGNFDDSIKYILEKIENIIGGKYFSILIPTFHTDKIDNTNFHEYKPKKVSTVTDTPSGIKQMGIIQMLLLNNKLENGDYLIIDEPEVNLHPDWQFKFAEILVLLAKQDITIYINSHSPLFIESIAAFSEFYDMEDDVNYYLTETSESEGKYDFVKINSDEIFRIYDNMGNAYDLIDQLRLKKRLGE